MGRPLGPAEALCEQGRVRNLCLPLLLCKAWVIIPFLPVPLFLIHLFIQHIVTDAFCVQAWGEALNKTDLTSEHFSSRSDSVIEGPLTSSKTVVITFMVLNLEASDVFPDSELDTPWLWLSFLEKKNTFLF